MRKPVEILEGELRICIHHMTREDIAQDARRAIRTAQREAHAEGRRKGLTDAINQIGKERTLLKRHHEDAEWDCGMSDAIYAVRAIMDGDDLLDQQPADETSEIREEK